MVVSDRAKALVQVCGKAYLDAASMPDLFHFVRDCQHMAGLRLGKLKAQAAKKLSEAKASSKEDAEKAASVAKSTLELGEITKICDEHRNEIEKINTIVHPFDSGGGWSKGQDIAKGLTQSIRQMCHLGTSAGVEAGLDKIQKVNDQIGQIAQGVEAWVAQTQQDIQTWAQGRALTGEQRVWFDNTVLPTLYWQHQLNKIQPNTVNEHLRQTYKELLQQAKERYQAHPMTLDAPPDLIGQCLLKGQQLVERFHRASSKVEGRNGYLSFMQHANKGIDPVRQKVLTVVHNFDIRADDKKTPAERLFGQEFPDLFQFVCQNVTGFVEPRKNKGNSLIINAVQR